MASIPFQATNENRAIGAEVKSARVLYLCSGRSFSGRSLGRKLTEVAGCWRRAGHDVRHVCGGDLEDTAAIPATYGSQQHYQKWYRKIPGIAPFIATVSEWRDIRHDDLLLGYLQEVCKTWQPEIIWERSCRLHCAGLTLARQIGVPYVLEWKDHLIDYRLSLARRKALRMEELKYREADYVVIESGVLRDQLGREGVDTSKIIVAHNAADAGQFVRVEHRRIQVRKEMAVDDDAVLVGYLGSYAFYHDTARLVLAADIIRKKMAGVKVRILMVGAGKEYAGSRRLADDLGLLNGALVMKAGVPLTEVPGLLAALDVAVLPGSTDIICPIKVQEYMACELPTVVPDYPCNREVIRNGETGILFEPKDEISLAEKIGLLGGDRQLRERIGRQARAEVIKRFSWEATWGAALETVLERVRGKQQNGKDE